MKCHTAAALAVLLFTIPSAASACAVCFGGTDSSLAGGFFWGVLILLVLPFALTAGFVTMIARASRKKAS